MSPPLADTARRAVTALAIVGLAALALCGAAVLFWMWMASSSNGSPPPAEPAMLALPESALVYPNATNIKRTGQGTECRDGLWSPSLIDVSFTTHDSTHDVFVWYAEKLRSLGWEGAVPETQSTGYSLTRAPDELFDVNMELNIDGSPYRVGESGTQFRTDFQHNFKHGHC